MRIGLQGWGSEGDLRPLIALAARIRKSGHEARLVLTPIDGKDYLPLCESLGISLQTVPERMDLTLQQLVRNAKSSDPTKLMTAVLDLTFNPYLEAMYTAALDLCAASDVVVGSNPCWLVKAACLRAGVPFVSLDYIPALVPSREVPPVIFPAWRWLARPAWALTHVMMDMAFTKAPRKFFAEKGLPTIRHAIPDVVFSDRLNLHAASPSFWPPAPDWPDIHCTCGELLMPLEAEAWAPSTALRAFLEEGSEPVLLTLGSWEHMAAERVQKLLMASARHAKTRAIIQTKTSNDEVRDGDLFILPWAPHRRLVPSCSVVVHHGGAGTTHMALRAGKPSVVLPFIIEQRLWAKRVEQVGAGTGLSFWKATPEKVGAMIREAVDSASLQRGASDMAKAMAGEDGSGIATRRLEGLVSGASSAAVGDAKRQD